MTAPKLMVSCMVLTLMQALITLPAFAGFIWDNGPEVTSAHGENSASGGNSTYAGPPARIVTAVKVATRSGDRMALRLNPKTRSVAAAEAVTNYSYIASSQDLPMANWSKRSSTDESFAYFDLGDRTLFNRLHNNGKLLEWRVHKKELLDSMVYLGATAEAPFARYDAATVTAAPIPAGWLLGAGIVGLIGIMRRNQNRPACQR